MRGIVFLPFRLRCKTLLACRPELPRTLPRTGNPTSHLHSAYRLMPIGPECLAHLSFDVLDACEIRGEQAPGMDRTTNQSLYGKLIVGFVKAHVCSLVYRTCIQDRKWTFNGRALHLHAEGFAAFGISWHREPCPLRREAFRWYRRPSDNWQFPRSPKALVLRPLSREVRKSAVLPMRRRLCLSPAGPPQIRPRRAVSTDRQQSLRICPSLQSARSPA